MVARDIALVRLTGAPCTSSTSPPAGRSSWCVWPRREGLPVTAEAAPHHMLLTHAAVADYDPVFKVNPPLRTTEDVAAVVAGLCDGTIDAIATDHAPHAPEAKDAPFDQAPPGMLGLQTALPIAWQVLSPDLGPERIFALMSAQPAAIARLRADRRPDRRPQCARRAGRSRGGGQPLRVRSRRPPRRSTPMRLASRSRNTPYAGRDAARARCATPCCAASRSSSTRRRSGDAATPGATGPGGRPVGHGRRRRLHRRGRRRAPVPVADRRARLQHRHERLPGGDHRSVLRRAGHRVHQHPHRQLRHQRSGRRSGRAVTAAAWWCATCPRSPRTGASTEALEPFLVRHGVPALTGVDTRRLARHVREAGAVPCAFGTARRGGAAGGGRGGRRHRRPGPGHGRDGGGALRHGGGGPAAPRWLRIVAYDFGVKTTMVDLLTTLGARHRGPGRHGGRRRPRPRARRRVPLQRPRRPGRAGRSDRRRGRPGGPGAHLRHLPGAPAPGHCVWAVAPTSCRSGITGPTTRCSASSPAWWRSPARTTTTPWRADSVPDAEVTHVNLNDGVIEGFRCRRRPPSRCSTTRRRRRDPTTPATSSTPSATSC